MGRRPFQRSGRPQPQGKSGGTARTPPRIPEVALLGVLLAAMVARLSPSLGYSFYNDDYVYLEAARERSLLEALLHPIRVGGYLRPFSLDVHFEWTTALFGLDPFPHHVVNLGLVLVCTVLVWRLGKRTISPAGALLAAALFALSQAQAVLVGWVSCAQDLWANLFSLLAALLLLRDASLRSRILSAVAFGFALLSKESAVALPAMLFLLPAPNGEKRKSVVRVWPHLIVLAAWVVLYLLARTSVRMFTWDPGAMAALPLRFFLSLLGIEGPHLWFGPGMTGIPWLPALLVAAFGVALLGVPRAAAPAAHAARAWGMWAVIGLLPLLTVAAQWSAYYFVLASAGAWLALGAVIGAIPRPLASLLPLLLLWSSQRTLMERFDPAQEPPDPAISAVSAQRLELATEFERRAKTDLRAAVPAPERGALFLFYGLPARNGFLSADGPAIRLLYGDPSLAGLYVARLRPEMNLDRPLHLFVGESGHLRLSPLRPQVLHTLQAEQELRGEHPAAIALVEIERRRQGNAPLTEWNLGYLYWETGDSLRALASWQKPSAAPEPDSGTVRSLLRQVDEATDPGRRMELLLALCMRAPRDRQALLAAAREAAPLQPIMSALLYYRLSLFEPDPSVREESRREIARQGYAWAAGQVPR